MNRRKKKLTAEQREELNKQYLTIAELLIKIVGESTKSKILRALLVGGIVAASQAVTTSPELPEGALPERVEATPAHATTVATKPR